MADSCPPSSEQRDLIAGWTGLALWRVPLLLIFVGLFWPAGRFWLWIPSFLVSGSACLVNALRCGRVHCWVTAPLYLGAALYLAGVLSLPERVPFEAGTFLLTVFGLALIARMSERVTGAYRKPVSRTESRPDG